MTKEKCESNKENNSWEAWKKLLEFSRALEKVISTSKELEQAAYEYFSVGGPLEQAIFATKTILSNQEYTLASLFCRQSGIYNDIMNSMFFNK